MHPLLAIPNWFALPCELIPMHNSNSASRIDERGQGANDLLSDRCTVACPKGAKRHRRAAAVVDRREPNGLDDWYTERDEQQEDERQDCLSACEEPQTLVFLRAWSDGEKCPTHQAHGEQGKAGAHAGQAIVRANFEREL